MIPHPTPQRPHFAAQVFTATPAAFALVAPANIDPAQFSAISRIICHGIRNLITINVAPRYASH
jgi:hypothetical protein